MTDTKAARGNRSDETSMPSLMKIEVIRLTPEQANRAADVLLSVDQVQTDQSHLRSFLADSRNYFVAASVQERWIGYAIGYELPHPERPAGMLFLYSIDVAANHRRKGVGSRIIKFLRSIAETRHLAEVFVFTNHSNPAAVAFYKQTGGMIKNGDDLLFVYPTSNG